MKAVIRQEARTASVRDLRNHFADVAKWIEDGEQVMITRNGSDFAMLTPARAAAGKKPDWNSWLKAHPPIPARRKLTKKEMQAFYDEMRGGL
jgi:prevent-host-death family protein